MFSGLSMTFSLTELVVVYWPPCVAHVSTLYRFPFPLGLQVSIHVIIFVVCPLHYTLSSVRIGAVSVLLNIYPMPARIQV